MQRVFAWFRRLSCLGKVVVLFIAVTFAPCVLALPFVAASSVERTAGIAPSPVIEADAPTTTPAVPTMAPVATPVPPGYVSRADLGDAWPLTVESAVVECLPGRVLVVRAEGVTYALNGTAKDRGNYADIDPIWRDNPSIEGLKISLQPLLDRGLASC